MFLSPRSHSQVNSPVPSQEAPARSSWSDAVGINLVGWRTTVSVLYANPQSGTEDSVPSDPDSKAWQRTQRKGEFVFGVAIDNAPGKFLRSIIVTVTPHVLVVNHCGFDIEYRQLQRDAVGFLSTPSYNLRRMADDPQPPTGYGRKQRWAGT